MPVLFFEMNAGAAVIKSYINWKSKQPEIDDQSSDSDYDIRPRPPWREANLGGCLNHFRVQGMHGVARGHF